MSSGRLSGNKIKENGAQNYHSILNVHEKTGVEKKHGSLKGLQADSSKWKSNTHTPLQSEKGFRNFSLHPAITHWNTQEISRLQLKN